jgi:S1-C subfamily serine protease
MTFLVRVFMGLAVAAGLALPGAAAAQNSFEQFVITLLGLQHRYEDYEPANLPDWTGALRRADQDRQIEQFYELEAGVTYRIVGACDRDCTNMDMEVFDPSGVSVGSDLQPNDRPYVEVTPTVSGRFRVHPWVVVCRARPCYGGVRVLKRQPQQRSGTAFLISAAGHLLTANHVVQGRTTVTIHMADRDVPARVLVRDPANDVALLQADISGTPLPLTSASTVSRGQEVMSLGYPLVDMQGESQKAGFGRVNALSGLEDDIRFLQMDVPTQPGNSGGPLLNQQGQVVGIVTATINQRTVISRAATIAQNVNYALKIDYALPMLPPEARPTNTSRVSVTNFEDTVRVAEASVYRISAE